MRKIDSCLSGIFGWLIKDRVLYEYVLAEITLTMALIILKKKWIIQSVENKLLPDLFNFFARR